jgi:putative heme iron utilization protein
VSADHAIAARLLLRHSTSGTLGTLTEQGSPFVSLVACLDDGAGRPLFLFTALAEHTRNLKRDPRASLLVAAETTKATLDRPRVTLVGKVDWLNGAAAELAKQQFADTLPEAKVWVTLPDFKPARLAPEEVRYVGGFARAAQLSLDAYLAAN